MSTSTRDEESEELTLLPIYNNTLPSRVTPDSGATATTQQSRDEEQPRSDSPPPQPSAQNDTEDDEDMTEIVERYSKGVVSLLKPVSVAMLVVVWATVAFSAIIGNVTYYNMLMLYRENETDSFWLKFGGSILNAMLIVAAFVVVTLILVLLYKYRCMKIIYGWLIGSAGLLLFTMGWVWLQLIVTTYQLPVDYVTFYYVLLNFTAVGLLSIFWRTHRLLNQAYLIAISSMTAWWMTRLPEWSTWAILAAVAIYDIVAVLTPRGPLRVLVETAQERNEPIPGLIYESETFKLGLGDFVFYSVLVGRAAMYDTITLGTSFIGILAGLCITLFFLGIFRKALPALPFSIAIGMICYFLTRFVIMPFVIEVSVLQHVAI